MTTRTSRQAPHILDIEREEERAYLSHIEDAADAAARSVDIETAKMFIARGLDLPPRLAKARWVRNYLHQSCLLTD